MDTPPPDDDLRQPETISRAEIWRHALVKYLLLLPLGLVAMLALAAGMLDTAIGHRLLADTLAQTRMDNGLHLQIGRIDGSVYGRATLEDVTVMDVRGPFLKVPVTTLDWNPFAWFTFGLDIHELTLRRGQLLRLPALHTTIPNGPLLPDFNIRVDRLAIERLTIAKGIMAPGPQYGGERRIDFRAQAELRQNRARFVAQGRLGGGDRLMARLDADRTQNRFVLALDYAAPKGGLLAALTGAHVDREAKIGGRGTWAEWRGRMLVSQSRQAVAALDLGNRNGQLVAAGKVWTFAFPERAQRIAGAVVAVKAAGTLADSVLSGRIGVHSAIFDLAAAGATDLAHATVNAVALDVRLAPTDLFGAGSQTLGTHLHARLDGRFAALTAPFTLTADRFADNHNQLEHIAARGTAQRDGALWRIPLDLSIARIITGHPTVDPRLVNAHGRGTLVLAGTRISGHDLAVSLPGASARLALDGDVASASYNFTGPVQARGWRLANLGMADADAAMVLKLGPTPVKGSRWDLALRLNGRLARIDNATLAALAGDRLRFNGTLSGGSGRAFGLDRGSLTASLLNLQLTGRRLADGASAYIGSGHQATYGAFTFATTWASDGPHGSFHFADPLPAAGIRDVELAIAPIPDGFGIDATGTSTLGPFAGNLALYMAANAPTRIAFQHFKVSDTAVTGTLELRPDGPAGELALGGGGVAGTLRLSPRGGAEAVDVALALHDAHFGGAQPLSIAEGEVNAHGLLAKNHTTLTGSMAVAGVGMGRLFIGRLTAATTLSDGRGQILATINGRRGSQFDLQIHGDVAPDRLVLLAGGHFGGLPIVMPRRAVVTWVAGPVESDWHLAPTELDYAGGKAIASGSIGADARQLDLALANMPLSISDVVFANLGLGGSASGLFHYEHVREQMPVGEVQLMLRGLTRSGLVLTSRPIDIALVAKLGPRSAEARAVASEGGQARGRLQARIDNLPTTGAPGAISLGERLRAGSLLAQMRYSGPADAPFRLLALEHFDLTGPVELAADVSGNLDNPVIRGSLASNALRLQSTITGMDITQIVARGSFTGSQLTLSSLAGRTAGGGQMVGSGTIGFADLGANHGPTLDLAVGAQKAQLMARPDMALTATGPLRIISDGSSGTIAGRLRIDNARWALGQSAVLTELPNIPTREINRSADIAPASASAMPWNFLIDAAPGGRIRVEGLGINSNWSANIKLRGTLDAPEMAGFADLIDGTYDFAGRRFDLTRGHLTFIGTGPPDPRLDISATAAVTGLTATVSVTGTSLHPDIAFSSVPALPEEDLLARVLFGDSITSISAPEALELGSALAALHGGGGLDPINKLRRAIGLDRLRIVAADVTIPRQTGFGAGKYLGRRVYAEIITDGRGYSATNLEFRITRWLSLLGSVSTVNRQNINAKISKDY
ncbi:MAG: translocation/assembly module TamB domain-containing protein [Pseudomonadota bacterium]|nr:translocation/assembly module TamB domain-containing protein [Pseudomonadota bacterium]